MLIGITGKAGAGKDTLAELMWKGLGFTRLAFADPLKRAAQEIFGLSDAQTWSCDLKELDIPYWGMSPRRMFQLLGTEAMQPTFGREVWIKRWQLAYELIKDSDHVVVPDVRFDTEALMIRERGGFIVRVERNGDTNLSSQAQQHASENGLTMTIDLVIHNQGEPQEMMDTLLDFIKQRGLS